MQTHFTLAQLADPDIEEVNGILRACVHCGFCTATCPTYVTLGDELDSPRGRIYQIKSFLEEDRAPTAEEVKHIDRCLSCLSCMTTCPASVHYMHLVDHARAHIRQRFRRRLFDRLFRRLLAFVLPVPWRFRLALLAMAPLRHLGRFAPRALKPLFELAPARVPNPSPVDQPQVRPPTGPQKKRVALLSGCAQTVLAPSINEATVRLLNRLGCAVVVAKGAGCCGSLLHHMGETETSHAQAKRNIDAWYREIGGAGLDAVIINASGCGTTVKDYGFMFRNDPEMAEKARAVSALARDITEFLEELNPLAPKPPEPLNVTYHAACSMQHGQGVRRPPVAMLRRAGFNVTEPGESHLCCGSAGTYNILQPKIAGQLRDRKLDNIADTLPDVIATGNIGCMVQLAGGTDTPVVHTVELLDWAWGGPAPRAVSERR